MVKVPDAGARPSDTAFNSRRGVPTALKPGWEHLANELGATQTMNGRDADVVSQVAKMTEGGTDHSHEGTAIPAVLPMGPRYGLIGAAALGHGALA